MYSYLQFGNPTNNKTETGTANRRATTNSKPPGPIIMMTQSKTLSSSQVQFIILFLCRCTTTTQTELCYIMLSQNHFPEPNRRVLTFLHHPKMYCAGFAYTEHRWRCSNKGNACNVGEGPGHEHSCVLRAKGRGIDSSECFLRGWGELTIDF